MGITKSEKKRVESIQRQLEKLIGDMMTRRNLNTDSDEYMDCDDALGTLTGAMSYLDDI